MADQYTILPGPFDCEDFPDPRMDLQAMRWQLHHNPRFKRFIRDQVQRANKGDVAAQACLAGWYMPTDDELTALGLPEGTLRCTEHSHLIAADTIS